MTEAHTEADPSEVVNIRHPDVDGLGTATRDAATRVWGPLGWEIVEFVERVTVPSSAGDPPAPLTAPGKNESTAVWQAFLLRAGIPHDPDGSREDFIGLWEASPLNS